MTVSAQRTKRRQSPEETRAQILEAAQDLLRERSFRELSVDDVMTRTGHTRTVFYRHFDGIPTLVLTLIAEVGGELLEVGRAWAEIEEVGPQQARERLAVFVDYYARHGPVARAVAEAAHHDATVEAAYSQMVENFIAVTARAVASRVQSGELEPLDAPEVARALVRMLNAYLSDALGREPYTDPERVLDVVWTIWTRTLFPGRAAS